MPVNDIIQALEYEYITEYQWPPSQELVWSYIFDECQKYTPETLPGVRFIEVPKILPQAVKDELYTRRDEYVKLYNGLPSQITQYIWTIEIIRLAAANGGIVQ